MYKIGVISDTHNLLRENVTDILRTCNAILHGGDICRPDILEQLKAIAPLYAVRGNTDQAFGHTLPASLSFELFGLKLFLIHNKKMIQQDIHDRDIVIYGHAHKYEALRQGSQTWLNPGSCGPARFHLPVTMAVIAVNETDASYQIECIRLTARPTTGSLGKNSAKDLEKNSTKDMKAIVLRVMKDTDNGKPISAIARKNHISEELATQICRLYVTHPGVSAEGILQKMGL